HLKVLVIGLDGASPVLIRKWIDRLPNIRRLSESGVHGVLESVVPPASVPAWQCFASGKNPAKIGLFGFATISRDRHLVKHQAGPDIGCIWDIASQNGLRVGVFNVPGTYPPYPLNGFMVCGFPVPPRKKWAYPDDLMGKLDKTVGNYEVDVPLTKPSEMRGGEEAYLSQVERLHGKSVRSALALMEWYRPDLFVMTLQGIDMVQHDFWRYMGREGSPHSNVLQDWYVKMDLAVGELTSKVEDKDNEVHVLIMSDHGSIPVSTSFHVNEYLQSKGLLVLKNGAKVTHKGSSYTKLRRLILRNFPPEYVNAIYNRAPGFIARRLTTSAKLERFLTDLIDNVDWDHSNMFSTGGVQANIYLNPKFGEDTAKDNLSKLYAMLTSLRHPTTGENIQAVFHSRDQVFSGPFKSEAPDVCVELFVQQEKIHVNPTLGSNKVWSFDPHLSAEHVRDGFWSLTGPMIQPGTTMDAGI
ncbi:MAG TPA: alkaline phosphatase family protein, partial [Candidatus Binatus sp.]|nr:alkaline phosphatase family protein [Candidatus Binatus sp.]